MSLKYFVELFLISDLLSNVVKIHTTISARNFKHEWVNPAKPSAPFEKCHLDGILLWRL